MKKIKNLFKSLIRKIKEFFSEYCPDCNIEMDIRTEYGETVCWLTCRNIYTCPKCGRTRIYEEPVELSSENIYL